jgi:hypothetical protein
MESRAPIAGQSGRIFIFGFLSAIAPLSIDIGATKTAREPAIFGEMYKGGVK